MKEYKFMVTVYEGCDEWWEELDAFPIDIRLEKIQLWLSETLDDNYIEHKVENKNYYQQELPL